MSLADLKNSTPQEAAANANKATMVVGKYDAAFTYFKYNEEKKNFSFGFFLHAKAKMVFQSFKAETILAEAEKWKLVDQNDSHWKAMKHISQTVKLMDLLYNMGRLTPEGNIKGLRSAEGMSLTANCSASEEGYQQIAVSPNKRSATYDQERVTLEGTPKFNDIVAQIPTNCVAWLYKKFEENSFTTIDPNVYDLTIVSYKHTPANEGKSPAKDGFVFMASKDDSVYGRIYISFRRNVAEDVARLQQLASIIGFDDKKYKGTTLRGLIGIAETRDGNEFNVLEMAYHSEPQEKAIVTPIADVSETTEVVAEPSGSEFD
jgi:hypothetical protein